MISHASGKSFVLYKDFKPILDKLSDEQAGQLLKAIYRYQVDGVIAEMDLALDLVFTGLAAQFDRDRERYGKICARNRENGRNGGRPRKDSEAEEPIGFSGNPNNPAGADSDSDSDSENENDTSPQSPPAGGCGDWDGIFPDGALRKSKTEQAKIKCRRTNPRLSRLGRLFGRQEATLPNVYEAAALKDLDPTEDDIDLIERYYRACPEFLRQSLGALLNNWSSELDKARLHFKDAGQRNGARPLIGSGQPRISTPPMAN